MSETVNDAAESFFNACAQIAGKNGGLARNIKGVLARLSAYVEYLTLLDDYHALTVRNGDAGALGDNVIASACIGGFAVYFFASLLDKDVIAHSFAVKKFLPLIGKNAANGADGRFNKTHM